MLQISSYADTMRNMNASLSQNRTVLEPKCVVQGLPDTANVAESG